MNQYHVKIGAKRTTVSLSEVLCDLLALKLGSTPRTAEANQAVQGWLQGQLDAHNDPGRLRVSQWLTEQVVLEIVDKMLSKQYDEWILSGGLREGELS